MSQIRRATPPKLLNLLVIFRLNKEINEIERTINKKRKKAAKRAKREAKENLTKEAKENMATQEAKERAKAEEL